MLANTFLTTPSANANTFLSLPTLFSQQIFDLGHFTFFSLSLFSLCGIYPRGRSFLIKLQKSFSYSISALWKLSLRQTLMNFDSSLLHFLLVFLLSVCHLTQGNVGLHKNTQKTFFLSLLLSVKALLAGRL
jgi:hypothetical protein